MKYVFIVIIIALVIALIAMFVVLGKLMKKLAITNSKVEKLNTNINEAKQKKEAISKTKDSWSFFASIFIIISVLKETMNDYKDTKKRKRNIAKSFTKTCAKNISKISKIKII